MPTDHEIRQELYAEQFQFYQDRIAESKEVVSEHTRKRDQAVAVLEMAEANLMALNEKVRILREVAAADGITLPE